ncbi:MAG: hypothetical protein KAS32_04570 [Candidatus Peribacteraceae bacterium]|nr:hypothetical protein [Candidatus Peribacteraceae bacterium]
MITWALCWMFSKFDSAENIGCTLAIAIFADFFIAVHIVIAVCAWKGAL